MPETVPHESPAHSLPPDTYAAVLANNPDIHPDLESHLQRLAGQAGEPGFTPGAVAEVTEQVSVIAVTESETVTAPPASLETVDSATLLDAEANISHHDWNGIGAESSPSDAHGAAHNTLAAKFGATNADPATKLEVAVEAELGAGARLPTVTIETPSEETITIVHDLPEVTSVQESAQNTDGEHDEFPDMPPGWGKLTSTNASDQEFLSRRQGRIDQLLSGGVDEHVVDALITEGLSDAFFKTPDKFPEATHQRLVEGMAENGMSGFMDTWDKLPGVTDRGVVGRKLIAAGRQMSVALQLESFPNQDELVNELMDPSNYDASQIKADALATDAFAASRGGWGSEPKSDTPERSERRGGVDPVVAGQIAKMGETLLGKYDPQTCPVDVQTVTDGMLRVGEAGTLLWSLQRLSHYHSESINLSADSLKKLVDDMELHFTEFNEVKALFDHEGQSERVVDMVHNPGVRPSGFNTGEKTTDWNGLTKALEEGNLSQSQFREVAGTLARKDGYQLAAQLEFLGAQGGLDTRVLVEAFDKCAGDGPKGVGARRMILEGIEHFDAETVKFVKMSRDLLGGETSTELLRAMVDINGGEVTDYLKDIGVNATGGKGEQRLRQMMADTRIQLLGLEVSEEALAKIIANPIKIDVLKAVARYEGSEFGPSDSNSLRELIRYHIAAAADGRLEGLGAEYQPSEAIALDVMAWDGDGKAAERAEQGGAEEWSKDLVSRYTTLRGELEQAVVAYDNGESIGQGIDGLREGVETAITALDEKIDDPSLPERAKDSFRTRRDQLRTLVTPADPDKPGQYPLRSVRSLEQNFRLLAQNRDLHPQLRKFVFSRALYKHPESRNLVDNLQAQPSIESVSSMREFTEHIVNLETFSQYFTDEKSATVFRNMLGVKSLDEAIARRAKSTSSTGKQTNIQFVPTRGVMMELSGHIGDACWAGKYDSIAEAMPNMTAVIVKQSPGTKSERLTGVGMLIETKDSESGAPTLLVRGLNPVENMIQNVAPGQFYDEFIGYARQIAARKGMQLGIVLDDHSGGATSNRPVLFEHIAKTVDKTKLIRVPDEDVAFNGYSQAGTMDANGQLTGQFQVYAL